MQNVLPEYFSSIQLLFFMPNALKYRFIMFEKEYRADLKELLNPILYNHASKNASYHILNK